MTLLSLKVPTLFAVYNDVCLLYPTFTLIAPKPSLYACPFTPAHPRSQSMVHPLNSDLTYTKNFPSKPLVKKLIKKKLVVTRYA